MKQDLKLTLIFLLILSAILFSCLNREQMIPRKTEDKFKTAIPMTNINEIFQVKIDGDEKNFKSGSEIPIIFSNKSSNSISFAPDSFIRLFVVDNKSEWIEIKNEITYSGLIQLAPQGTILLDSTMTEVKPVLDDGVMNSDKKDTLLRILMTGEIMQNDVHTGKLVGAYVDVYITP